MGGCSAVLPAANRYRVHEPQAAAHSLAVWLIYARLLVATACTHQVLTWSAVQQHDVVAARLLLDCVSG